MINLAIIEDDLEIRKTLSDHFNKSDKIDCVMVVDTVERFLKYHRDFIQIDILLLDVFLYQRNSILDIPTIRQRIPDSIIIIFTVSDDSNVIFQALSYGASGYYLKEGSPEDLESALLRIYQNGGALLSPVIAKKVIEYFLPKVKSDKSNPDEPLTPKEIAIVRYIYDGLTYEEAAQNMGITVNGIRYYIKSIYKKLEINSRHELYAQVQRKPGILALINNFLGKG